PNEIATLIVNGEIFKDWESIFVRHAFDEPFYWFRFTASEGAPLAKNWAAQRIRPGDKCEVYLAGILAVSGRVKTRQVSTSAKHHAIEIQGGGFTFDLTRASVVSKTGVELGVAAAHGELHRGRSHARSDARQSHLCGRRPRRRAGRREQDHPSGLLPAR